MRRRTTERRVSSTFLGTGLSAFALGLGAAAACYEIPPNNPEFGGAAGFDSGGEGSSDDDSPTGGVATGGSPTGGAGGSAGSGGAGTGGSAAGSGGTGGAGSGGDGTAGTGGKAAGEGGSGGSGGGAGKGGAGGKAGTGGGAGGFSTDRDEFFGASRCSSEFALCEDFERTTLDTARWRVQASGPAPTIDSTRAARGMRSAHFHTEDNGLSLIHTTSIFPAANNTYWGRMFVYFDTMPTAPMWAHWSIAAAVGSGNEAEIRVGGQWDGMENRFGVGTDHGPTGDWTNLDEDPGDPVPVDTWVCVEWLHKGDTNETRFYWDGVEHPSLHTTATEHGGTQSEDYLLPEFESVFVGWWLYQADTTPPEFDVWIDEVALDGERIGCSR